MHVRSQFRSVVEAHLKANVPSVDGAVFTRYQDPAFTEALETADHTILAVAIMTTAVVDGGSSSGGPGLQQRDLNLEVTAIGLSSETLEDELEATAVEVEAAFADPGKLPVKLLFLRPTGDELIEIGETDRGTLLGLKLKFTARVGTLSGRPDQPILKG